MKKKKTDQFTFSIVPNFIKPQQGLSPMSKLIYGDIYSLAHQKGFCFASNTYFEKLYRISKSTVTKSINELQKLEYIICEYEHRNSRKIYLTEKKGVDKPDLRKIEDDKILPSVEEQMPNSNHLKNQKQPSPSLNSTIMMVKKYQYKVNDIKVDNKTDKYIKRENRSSNELPLTFSNIDDLERILLHDLSVIYHTYKYFDLDSIITSIEEALESETCKEEIFQLGFKEWFRSILKEEELVESDEKLTEQDFLSLSGMFIDQFFNVLTS
jgi:hypothetical protein